MVTGSCWVLDLDSDLGLGEMEETERNNGRGGEDICKEYILTWWGSRLDCP